MSVNCPILLMSKTRIISFIDLYDHVYDRVMCDWEKRYNVQIGQLMVDYDMSELGAAEHYASIHNIPKPDEFYLANYKKYVRVY